MYGFVSCSFFGTIVGNFASFRNSSAFPNLEWDRKITLSSNELNGELPFRIGYLGLSAAISSQKTRFCISPTIFFTLFFIQIGVTSPTVHCSNSAILDGLTRWPLFWANGYKLGTWLFLCRFPGVVASNLLSSRGELALTLHLLLPSWKTYDSTNLLRSCVKSSDYSTKANFQLTAKLWILLSRDLLHLTI